MALLSHNTALYNTRESCRYGTNPIPVTALYNEDSRKNINQKLSNNLPTRRSDFFHPQEPSTLNRTNRVVRQNSSWTSQRWSEPKLYDSMLSVGWNACILPSINSMTYVDTWHSPFGQSSSLPNLTAVKAPHPYSSFIWNETKQSFGFVYQPNILANKAQLHFGADMNAEYFAGNWKMQPVLSTSRVPDYKTHLEAASRLAGTTSTMNKVEEELRLAINTCPQNPYDRAILASVCYQLGFYSLAVEQYCLATELQPSFADAYNNMGNAWKALQRTTEASRCYEAALAWNERHPHALNNLGNIYRDKGDLDHAAALYSKCLQVCPTLAAAHCNLGGICREKHLLKEAVLHFLTALTYDPHLAAAANGLGVTYRELNQNDEALKAFSLAASLQPYAAEHFANLGNTLKDLGRLEESVKCHRTAIHLAPHLEDAFSQLAHSMAMLCDWTDRNEILKTIRSYLDRILQLYRTTCIQLLRNVFDGNLKMNIKVRPECDDFQSSKVVYNIVGGLLYGCEEQQLLSSVISASNKETIDMLAMQLVQNLLQLPLPSVQPFHCLIYPVTNEQFRLLGSVYAARAAANVAFCKVPKLEWIEPQLNYFGGGRLKVGYVSSDFQNHPYGHLTQSIYGFHRSGKSVECFCYSLSPSDGSHYRKKIENEAEHFRDISHLTVHEAASIIANDGIHILINANGYTKGAKTEIFALRPAPVQVAFMGFAGSLGASYIEYMISDIVASPPEFVPECHTEVMLYHPHTYFVSDHKQSSPREPRIISKSNSGISGEIILTRESYGLPKSVYEGGDCTVLFANFNQLYKLDPSTLNIWCNILKRVPGSKIWLLRFPPAAEARLLAQVSKRHISTDRIIFTDVAPKEEHIARCGLADIFLDTPVCNAHTTATDALWSGLPVVTGPTVRLASRVAASVLHAAGLDELIARDMNEYQDIAIYLAYNYEKRLAIRKYLIENRDRLPLFDTLRWTRNLEALFWQAWFHKFHNLPDRIVYGQDVYSSASPNWPLSNCSQFLKHARNEGFRIC
ncbi:Probable UDP-N-acetylglucosamine--peptide N-acetylglucosaminyltransferase SEC [Galdieria sulphuraria]|uniref:protein O-GlcNAc transferase n=1 Tax=Galdieria sulphuraria TaxID=130081 RepID=M2Y6H5_GALSU|nr:polypeptide N-acetylglucosaminyltransferase [Galdieria sulphuraria]EME31449.1 polypeptide N-acetylglucosaminyltransferase [Galdieria sulphuraria]GJD06602.1 Probable UDP-N-acetylglucosamine--peptide N-acetylglucosaminyltransferase SEC [Galdieria sulphuraria]|eukprot:XP_005707969.1 polypeptide N-acetylglucosaminyltransferase [Galdieria sulphuraria]